MKKLLLLSALSVLLLSGCRFAAVEYTPQPNAIKNKEEAKDIILKVFSEQPRYNGAQQLTVYDDRIVFAEAQKNVMDRAIISSGRAIYFTTIDKLKLYRHRSSDTYNVDLWKNRTKVYAVRCYDEPTAKQFMDAFKFMQDFNKPAVPPAKPVPVPKL